MSPAVGVARRLVWLPILVLDGLFGCGSHGGAGNDVGAFPADAAPTPALGYAAVQARHCANCHQSTNPQDGVLSGQVTPVAGTQSYGSNLTPDPETGMDAWDAGTIAASVLDAIDDQGSALCPAMPAYEDEGMTMDEAVSIAIYLQGLTPVWHHVPPSACAAQPAEGGVDSGGE